MSGYLQKKSADWILIKLVFLCVCVRVRERMIERVRGCEKEKE